MVVIRVRENGSVAIPVILMLVHVIAKHGMNRAVVTLHLAIGGVRTRERVRDTHDASHDLEELGRELFQTIRVQVLPSRVILISDNGKLPLSEIKHSSRPYLKTQCSTKGTATV